MDRTPRPSPRQATAHILLLFVLLVAVGLPLEQRSLYLGLVLSEGVVLLGLTVARLRADGLPVGSILGLRRPRTSSAGWIAAGTGVLAWGMAMGLTLPLVIALLALGGRPPSLPLPLDSRADYVRALLVGVGLASVCEEVVFRGFLLSAFERRGTHLAVWTAAVCFGLFHFDPVRFVATTALGVVFGYLAVWTGSVWPAIMAHAANNFTSLTLARLVALRGEAGAPMTFDAMKSDLARELGAPLTAGHTGALAGITLAGMAAACLGSAAVLGILISVILKGCRGRGKAVSVPPALTVGSHLRLLAREPAAWGVVLCGVAFWGLALAVQFAG